MAGLGDGAVKHRLSELQPRLIAHVEGACSRITYRPVDRIEDAQGLRFDCPICVSARHQIVCWGEGVPADAVPAPGRWKLQGGGLADLTVGDDRGPALLQGACGWHGRVERGWVGTI